MTTQTQEQQILDYLESGLSLTAYGALTKFGCLRLSGRIHRLRERGHDIRTQMVELNNGKRIARYTLPKVQHDVVNVD